MPALSWSFLTSWRRCRWRAKLTSIEDIKKMVRKNAAAADEDPIMYEVDDDSGNKPLGKPSRKKDKGKDLLNKFSGGDGEEEGSSGARKPREQTAKGKKAKDKKVLSTEL